ncbi:cobalt-precorrin-5B (C(1))-methyltransferase [Brevibacillus laterosporus]|uniref:Cobalt-precorrin-5B C(1)-methyltransferase n=1 Tax=Brevibacillus laterosporus TaxID=1465 RepID=A0A518V7U6_BRELA|nr:cobalt-precorrin-5B (C(1))-methyltransferase [Brevibacillus laterosporus]QDX93039.1 cobalt-precorrin-5B (C(1))-methyltransferase [Brevibacillus laterosporus]TPG71380.1 cobalt-precorrin-5B (C(1))-methyltransferase [Brevibacillus laterosporus]
MTNAKVAEAENEKPLRHGYTTGSNATAATKASLLALLSGEKVSEVEILLPNKDRVTFQMVSQERGENWVETGIIKDGGDDPDATHKALILSRVSWHDDSGIHLDGGVGVGRVTKPGLPIPVGEAAINPVPRKMIKGVAQELLDQYGLEDRGVSIVISVPDGEEIAKKTLNGRLGIVGGISILGTRGTVVPFSTAAYKASVAQAIKVAKASNCKAIAITTGGRSEKTAMEHYPDWAEESFIQMGDFVGFSALLGKKQGFTHIAMVGMMGKLSKVAQGAMMVHSKGSAVDFQFLADVAREIGASEEHIEEIEGANTAMQVGEIMSQAGHTAFFELLAYKCSEQINKHVGGGMVIETVLTTLKGELLGKAVVDDTGNDNRDRG